VKCAESQNSAAFDIGQLICLPVKSLPREVWEALIFEHGFLESLRQVMVASLTVFT
jgi:hypothetical protein